MHRRPIILDFGSQLLQQISQMAKVLNLFCRAVRSSIKRLNDTSIIKNINQLVYDISAKPPPTIELNK